MFVMNTLSVNCSGVFFIHRFQSEKETGDRNFAIGYYLKEKKVSMFLIFIKILGFFSNLIFIHHHDLYVCILKKNTMSRNLTFGNAFIC